MKKMVKLELVKAEGSGRRRSFEVIT